jgi:hypothetical protein
MLNLQNTEFLTKDQIRSKTPSVFTSQGAPETSSKYIHISTERIVDDMNVLGWGVVDAKEVKSKKSKGFQKHLLVFRNNELTIMGKDGDDVFPQILLSNSHDGKSSFQFTAGLFRLICENGLVISNETFGDLKIRHMGYNIEELQQVVNNIIDKLPLTIESMNKLKSIQLSEEQQHKFALEALGLRFEEKGLTFDDSNSVTELLEATREKDKGDDVWVVMNRIQEKLIHGGFNYINEKGKTRKARKIKNFQQDIKLNQKLFNLALEFA